NELSKLDISVYSGIITKVNHTSSKVGSVTLASGENIQVDTLLWVPRVKPIQLIQILAKNLGLELNDQGYIKTDENLQTNVKGLYAAGDVKGSSPIGALAAAYNGGIVATSIVREWYH
ncbi:MAG TPA: FAD-dependent oxidoreductase, partial [Nitrososphaeraceae archaeon]|nr:FAD-dependent oxidoreductase [Nitrososphaeraceae archaeon]